MSKDFLRNGWPLSQETPPRVVTKSTAQFVGENKSSFDENLDMVKTKSEIPVSKFKDLFVCILFKSILVCSLNHKEKKLFFETIISSKMWRVKEQVINTKYVGGEHEFYVNLEKHNLILVKLKAYIPIWDYEEDNYIYLHLKACWLALVKKNEPKIHL